MNVKTLFIFSVSLSVAFSVRAQQGAPGNDTILKGSTIEVIQAYKPQVKQAPKPQWVPQLPPADTAHPVFNYDVPQQTLYYSYSSLPLRPLALGKGTGKPPFGDYIKAGGGNLSTLFLDAGIGRFLGPGYETNLHLHHISQKGKIAYQQTALTGAEAEGIFHKQKSDWRVGLSGARNEYNIYGGDLSSYIVPDSIKQVYASVKVSAEMESKPDSNSRISYQPEVDASLYTAKVNTSEITMGLNVPVIYKVDSTLDLQLAIEGAFTNLKTNIATSTNNFIELLPGLHVHNGPLKGHALVGLAAGKDKGYILPDVYVGYGISSKFTVSAGWQSQLHQNTYEQLTMENPYLSNSYAIKQSKTQEAFANLQGGVGDHITFSGRASWWNFNEHATFLNDSGDRRHFYVDYEDIKAISLKGAFRYQVANTWSVGGAAEFYSFSGGTEAHVWQQPTLKIKGDLLVVPVRKLAVTAYIAVLGGMYAKDVSHNPVKMKSIVDVGGNAEYQVIPRLSAFAQVSNLLNSKYQRWYGYQAYGLNVYGGIRFKF